MDISKLLTGVCVFLLLICIVFCTTALVALRNAVAESETLQFRSQLLAEELDDCIEQLEKPLKELTKKEDTSVSVTVVSESYVLRECNGVLCVYTSGGELVQRLDAEVESLPTKERELLRAGISRDSWKEMASLIQDYSH